MKWYRLAAIQGNNTAQYNLGCMYGKGEGVTQDAIEQYAWISLARLNGENQGEDCLKHLESKFTPEQLTKAKARFRELKSQN